MSTITMTSGRAGAAKRSLGSVSAFLASCLAACLRWRQQRLDIAKLRTMSDAELRDIGIERERIELSVMTGWRRDPWSHVNLV